MWTNERRENRSALERVTHELATMKKEYGMVIEKLKRELVEERKKSKHQFHRQRSKTHTDQVTAMKFVLTDQSCLFRSCLKCCTNSLITNVVVWSSIDLLSLDLADVIVKRCSRFLLNLFIRAELRHSKACAPLS